MVTSGDPNFDAEFNAGFAKLIANSKPNRKRSIRQESDYDLAEAVANVESDKPEFGQKQEAATVASLPTSDTQQDASSSVAPAVPNNPYSASKKRADDNALPNNPFSAEQKSESKVSGDDKVSPTSVSDRKLSSNSSSDANSARKPSRGASLMEFGVFQSSTPKPSSSQQTTTSASSSQQSAALSKRSISGPWHCHVCTFYNEENKWSRAKCAMCEATRMAPGDDVVLLDV